MNHLQANIFCFAVALNCVAMTLAVSQAAVTQQDVAEPVSFNRDIRPILSNHCFTCHGPDENSRQADLRIDIRQEAIDYGAIEAGHPDDSSMIERAMSDDAELVMPPPESGKPQLTSEQVQLLKKWIEQGAKYETHWSFVPPIKADFPKSNDTAINSNWTKHPIDQFVFSRMKAAGLEPSPTADKRTLARRAALSITGLPPTVEQLDAFLKDDAGDAYEKYVDRLLASPAYGERMAAKWMDIARYSDTDGFQADEPRNNWPWRDWVVNAYNKNMSFKQFTIEQFAGDLLDEATPDQILATCFHRNHMTNGEGGRDPAESRVDYVLDRVNTMGTAWLGLTLGCAQCHTHKYDPITQHEYYQLSAFFNSIDEDGRAGRGAKPYLEYKLKDAETVLREPQQQVKQRKAELDEAVANAKEKFVDWLATTIKQREAAVDHSTWDTIDFSEVTSSEESVQFEQEFLEGKDGSDRIATGIWRVVKGKPNTHTYQLRGRTKNKTIAAVRLELLPHKSHKNGGLSFAGNSNICLTDAKFQIGDQPIEFDSVWVDFQQVGFPSSNLLDTEVDTGWAVASTDMKRPRTVIFRLKQPVSVDEQDELNVALAWFSHLPTHWSGRFRLSISPHRLAQHPSELTKLLDKIQKEAANNQKNRISESVHKLLLDWYLAHDSQVENARLQLRKANGQLKSAKAKTRLKVMVLKEREKPRSTYVLKRGVWDQHGDEVQPLTPAVLNSLPNNQEKPNRLKLAEWLVDKRNPLTARVTVNRYWQMHFGEGLVRTPEDFGLQGEMPTHPLLLDWLAVEFMESEWDIKHLQRLIVTSETFKQSSKTNANLLEVDPRNRLLARGPRFRLPSAVIRDSALASAGLMNRRLGGPPVKPYQPKNVWSSSDQGRYPYVKSIGEDLYRRSLYTYWRRNISPPGMFDSAQRRVCTVNVIRTNSPMHALNLMNDTAFIEAARVLAGNSFQFLLQQETAKTSSLEAHLPQIIDQMFLRTLSRPASPMETEILVASFEQLLPAYVGNESMVDDLLQQGEYRFDPAIETAMGRPTLAALTIVASTILNLDEFLNLE